MEQAQLRLSLNDIRIKLFKEQDQLVFAPQRIVGAFAGKRGAKSVGLVARIIRIQSEKLSYNPKQLDPFLTVIGCPTSDMLENLTWKKFQLYAHPLIKRQWQKPKRAILHDNSEVMGTSLDRPARIEGLKVNHFALDECFQMPEQAFLEAQARILDQKGYITCTGSLGVQYVNPKLHWAYKWFKELADKETLCLEWPTSANPHIPREELERQKKILDPKTFRQLYEIDWDTPSSSAVFKDLDDKNIISYVYNPMLPTYIAVDWGWAHPMACLFIQYDARSDTVYVMSEIVKSELLIEDLYQQIISSPWKIDCFICDIAGQQEREQSGISNIEWFRKNGIYFKYRKSAVAVGIALMRSYVRNGVGFPQLFIDKNCVKTIDAMKQYRYKEVNGIIQNENPLKENDDAVDALRYFFVNILDKDYNQPRTSIGRTF